MKNITLPEVSSRTLQKIGVVFGCLFILLLVFAAGVQVGFHKARFSYAFSENYERNFANPRGLGNPGDRIAPMGIGRNMPGGEFRNAHGVIGEIISINQNSLVVKNKDNQESTVQITDQTIINSGRDTIQSSDLKVGDKIATIGKPGENGNIGAHLIRVLPGDMPEGLPVPPMMQ